MRLEPTRKRGSFMTLAVGISMRPVPPQFDGPVKGSSSAKEEFGKERIAIMKKNDRVRKEIMRE